GLLVGGLNPKITLIPRNANIEQGDIIINAQPELPYGLIIGSIFNIKKVSNSLFNDADIIFPYDINLINIVGIIK
ncbi:MAG: hypothetical protein N2Z85_00005, partial [Patescibacteria group bacterium]|nr:hypothetical protein [Patescibacteria group bacterium]